MVFLTVCVCVCVCVRPGTSSARPQMETLHRESGVSRHHRAPIEGSLKLVSHHIIIVLESLRGAAIYPLLCRETTISRTAEVIFFPSETAVAQLCLEKFPLERRLTCQNQGTCQAVS